jgi:TPR repeat protein/predicted Ser/Thr protein kinase
MTNPDPQSDLDLGQTIRGFVAGQKLFGRYTLARILGRGGMGVVWLARDEKLDREVALKFLPELMTFDEQAVVNLKRETKRSQELRHHHIVSVYDFVSDDRSACIAMEYIDGPTLSALKARKETNCLEVEELRPWVEQLCEAITYAHEKAKVVHRDLKPANLMVNAKGELKVTDFGIARTVSDSVSMISRSQGVSGTVVYMSPQQLDGERPSVADDIYAVGATLYELLTSRPPFYTGNIDRQIHENTPTFIATRRRELNISGEPVPGEWEQTIARCLAKAPTDRPQSTQELAERLCGTSPATRTRIGAITSPSSKMDRLHRPNKSPKIVIVAAIAVAAVAAVAAYVMSHRGEAPPATTAPMAQQLATASTVSASEKARAAAALLRQALSAKSEHKDKEAFDKFTEAGSSGNAEAMYELATCYSDGRGTGIDLEKSAQWMKRGAEAGYTLAQYDYAWILENGSGVPKDYGEAVKWYTKAAEAGYSQAQTNLGIMYDNGRGVPKDTTKAVFWYEKAAEQDEPHAETNLGQAYRLGNGVEQDYARAAEWYRRAAEQGFAPAQGHLGLFYREGNGVEKSAAQAAVWLSKAAEGGFGPAQRALAEMYESGNGVTKDFRRAIQWYQKAAAQGDEVAEYNLGEMYEEGRGVPKDAQQARDYLRRAAAHGSAQAQERLAQPGK